MAEAIHALGAALSCRQSKEATLQTLGEGISNILLSIVKAFDFTSQTHPSKATYTVLQSSSALLEVRILRVLSIIPAKFWAMNEDIGTRCMEGIVHSAIQIPSTECFRNLMLHILNPLDFVLGPWNLCKGTYEKDLACFEGASGGIEPFIWSLGARSSGNQFVSTFRTEESPYLSYPQSISLGEALLRSRVQVLASMFLYENQHGTSTAANRWIDKKSLNFRKDKSGERKACLLRAIAAPLVSAFNRAESMMTDESLGEAVMALAREISSANMSSSIPQRVSANLIGAAVRIMVHSKSHAAVQLLCQDAASTSSLAQRACFILALGAVNQNLGGLGISSVLGLEVDTLTALALASDASIATQILHVITTTAMVAGPAFIPYVSKTLNVAQV